MKKWDVPKNIYEIVYADEDFTWEDNSWEPILLSIFGDTSYEGRDIPLSWQVEFAPYGAPFNKRNEQLSNLGKECDGYGWANLINTIFIEHYPRLVNQLNFHDTDTSTCVVWTETESTCKKIIEVVHSLLDKGDT